MQFEEIDIDPAFAQGLLESSRDVSQRTLVRRRVDQLAHDMSNGNFRLTHQPVAIDIDGQVIDGQHRLTAVVESGLTVRMLVAYDVDPTTFGVIDTGRARSPSDALKISGLTNVNVKASAARLLLAYELTKGTTSSLGATARLLTSSDVQAVFDDSERTDLIRSGEQVAQRLASAVGRYGIKTWAIVPYVIMAESEHIGEAVRSEFFERLTDGAMLSPGSAILAMRRWMINESGLMAARAHERPAAFIANTIKTLNDYTSQRERQTVLWRPGREPVPVVEPIDPQLLELAAEEREKLERQRAGVRYRAKKAAAAAKKVAARA